MKKLILLFVPAVFLIVRAEAQEILYTASFENAVHHEARISIEVKGARSSTLTFRMSRSSPGRYAKHEFGKNVYDVEATDGLKPLPVRRADADVYEVSGNTGKVILRYTLYGNYADGTYAGIDPASIHLNMPATFMWVKGLDKAPIQIRFELPDSTLSIATQLKPAMKKNTFSAPGLQYFMDSPVKIGRLHWRSWDIEQGNQRMKIRLAAETEATEEQLDSLADMVKRITEQARAVFKAYPAYDYKTYTFISALNPYVYGDGMEHRNSTMITLPFAFTLSPDAIDVFAHEYFHCWNVERIRPKTLEPFNFEKSNMSNELWFAEGFTQYYGVLLMRRTGLIPESSYYQTISSLVNTKLNTPGATRYSPIQSSNMAVFTDAGVSVDKTNYPNIFTSYYTYGASLALALDLMLRTQFNKTLDDFMQRVWLNHGIKEIPYTIPDLQKSLAQVSSSTFAKSFFDNYIYGHNAPDYQALLAAAGLELQHPAAGKPWIGNPGFSEHDGLQIDGNTRRNEPLYEAGLDAGDVITHIDGREIRSFEDLRNLLAGHKPGDQLTIGYLHRGTAAKTRLIVKENPYLAAVPFENSGKAVTADILSFRKKWLGPQ